MFVLTFLFQMRTQSAVEAYCKAQMDKIKAGQLWKDHQAETERDRVQEEQDSYWVCIICIVVTLSQIQEGKEKVIAYASKKLNKQQQRYSVTRRELLAVVTFVDQFRHYLLGREFTVRTDHSSLRWLHNFKEPTGQLARWLETLSVYHMVLEHREGKKHLNADALSRKDYDKGMCPYYEGGVEPEMLKCKGCDLCKELYNDWRDFLQRVDTVTDLGIGKGSRGFLGAIALAINSSSAKCRAVTRSQSQAPSGDVPVQTLASDQDPSTSSSNWSGQYTDEEMNKLQREDGDLGSLHAWVDSGELPNKNQMLVLVPQ